MTGGDLPASPFKGLSAFDDSDIDALLFFGREREIEVIAANLQASDVTVLYGPSGVGKSSILRAGVARRLRREPDAAVELVDRWSRDGAELVRGVLERRRGDDDLYVILDQFEEYFVYHEGESALPDLLASVVADSASRVNVLIGIREDSLARLDAFRRALPNLLSNRLALDRLDRAAARDAILRPVARYAELTGVAVEVEPALVDVVLDEVAAGRVDLAGVVRGPDDGAHRGRIEAPYLQLVLQSVWEAERADGSDILRVATLERLGGSARIVQEHVDEAMADLEADEKRAAAAMYNHLVTPSGTKIAHRVGDLARYAALPEAQAGRVLEKLVRERIVRAGSEDGPASVQYEIFHDVLADAVLAWRARYEEQDALREAERRRRRALAVATAALTALILVAAIAVYALVERGNSRSQARRAHAEALAAQSLTQLGLDPSSSLRLAYDAARLRPHPREESVLRTALIADRLRRVLRARGPVSVVAFDASGRHELVGAADGKVRVYGDGSVRPLQVFDQGSPVTAAAIAPDGRYVAGGGKDGSLRIWDADSGRSIRGTHLAGGVRTIVSTSRGRRLVVATSGAVSIWRTRDGARVATFPVRGVASLVRVAVSPDARQAVVVYRFRVARVYALPSGRLLHRLAHDGFIQDAAYSPDGRLIATGGYAGSAGGIRLWDARSGRLVRELRGALLHVDDVSFSRDGSLVGAASAEGTARVWETKTGTETAIMIGHQNKVTSVDFNPAGTALVSASSDGTARVWGASGGRAGRLLAVLAGHGAAVGTAVFAPDGRSVLTGGEDGTARVWDPGSEPALTTLAISPVELTGLAIRAGGRRIAARRQDGLVEIRTLDGRLVKRVRGGVPGRLRAVDAQTGASAVVIGGTVELHRPGHRSRYLRHGQIVESVAFSPNGKLVVTASDDHDARVWDAVNGRLVQRLHGHFGPVFDARFSPDGRWIVTAGPISAGLWLVGSGAPPIFLDAPVQRPLSAAAFAGTDGRVVVVTSRDGTLRSYRCEICGRVDELLALARRRLVAERGR